MRQELVEVRLTLLPTLLLLFSLTGCDRVGGSAGSSPAPSDPVGSFKAYADRYVATARSQAQAGSQNAKSWLGENLAIDVRKADSLVTPFSGILKTSHKSKADGEELLTEVVIEFACQDQKWVLKRASLTDYRIDASGALVDPDEFDQTNNETLRHAYDATPQ